MHKKQVKWLKTKWQFVANNLYAKRDLKKAKRKFFDAKIRQKKDS